MAHNVEPMDIDSDFDNKENSVHNSNVYLRTPCTEKGYEELDVSELNMKLRYSMTPVTSPMSKSYTGNCNDSKNLESGDDLLNANLTRSYNSALTKSDIVNKSVKSLPLQSIPADQFLDNIRSTSVLRTLESVNAGDVTVTISAANENDNLDTHTLDLLSSVAQTPELLTPTKELPRTDGGSPIMRGIKSVLNMFRSSQSPIPPDETGDCVVKQVLSPADDVPNIDTSNWPTQAVLASTPIAANRNKGSASKKNSPLKESLVFNEDLEKELLWKDETTILFSQEKIPIHKLFYQQPSTGQMKFNKTENHGRVDNLNTTVEYMDISHNDSIAKDHTITQIEEHLIVGESDGEFVDCETTFTSDTNDVCHVKDNDNFVELNDKSMALIDSSQIIKPIEQNNETNPIINSITALPNIRDFKDVHKAHDDTIALDESKLDNKGTCIASEVLLEGNCINVLPNARVVEVVHETHNDRIALEEPKLETKETGISSEVLLEVIGNIDIPSVTLDMNKNEKEECDIRKIHDSQLECEADISVQPVEMHENKEGKQAKTEHVNDAPKLPQESIEKQFIDNLHNNPIVLKTTSETVCCPTESIQNRSVSQVADFIKDIPFDSSAKTTNTNNLEFNKLPGEESYEQAKLVDDIVKIEHNDMLPASIPLPDEDDFDSNMYLTTPSTINNSSLINKNIFEAELENKTCVDSMPIDFMVQAKRDINIAYCNDIHINTSTGLKNPKNECNFENCLIAPNKSENSDNPNKPMAINELTQNIEANADGVTSNAELKIEQEQSKTFTVSENIKLHDNDLSQFDKNCITIGTEKSTKFLINNHNEVAFNASNSNFGDQVKSNNVINSEICNEINYNNINANDLSHSDKQCYDLDGLCLDPKNINITVETAEDILPTGSNEGESNSNTHVETDCGLEINVNHIENLLEMSVTNTCLNDIQATKNDLLPDIIPDATSCNIPDKILTDYIKNVTEEKCNEISNDNTFEAPKNEISLMNNDKFEDKIDKEDKLFENNSPFISIPDSIIQTQDITPNLEEINLTKAKIVIPSPEISLKGYNFNFDEMDDPFATKTKIRLSPPPNSFKINSTEIIQEQSPQKERSKRRSQTERKKPLPLKNKINKTFSGHVNALNQENFAQSAATYNIDVSLESNLQDSPIYLDSAHKDNAIQNTNSNSNSETSALSSQTAKNLENESNKDYTKNNTANLKNKLEENDEVVTSEIGKSTVESLISSNELKCTSSSEQSTYYSAETSGESIKSKIVFNIPEIDKVSFNPLITKPEVCKSPSPTKNDNQEAQEYGNISDASCFSVTTDENNITVREVHTEDEDTIEGPFLEAEDLNDVDKISDFDSEDVDKMQFSELPSQSNEAQLEGHEMFIDAEAFEYLINQNNNVVTDSGKESLFLKFDPLFAKRLSTDGVLAALNKIGKRHSTPKKNSEVQQLDTTYEIPVPGPSTLNQTQKNESVEEGIEDLNVTVSKPMMVVNPAVNPIITPRTKTPTSSNRRSVTFSSPAIAVIDRLLSLSGNNTLLCHDSTITQVSRDQNEADHALTQLRELLAEKENHVYNLRTETKELKDRLCSLESQMQTLESESDERLKKINDLNKKLTEKTKANKSMAAVVEEYERTIAILIAESEQIKKQHNEERKILIEERNEQSAHLASMEISFNDLHSKYEKSKQVILSFKANEDSYKMSIKKFEDNLSKMKSNYDLLKQHATSKLNHANEELEKMNRAHEADLLKLKAMIRRKELDITSIEETLAQKTKANEELTALCDELINKVG